MHDNEQSKRKKGTYIVHGKLRFYIRVILKKIKSHWRYYADGYNRFLFSFIYYYYYYLFFCTYYSFIAESNNTLRLCHAVFSSFLITTMPAYRVHAKLSFELINSQQFRSHFYFWLFAAPKKTQWAANWMHHNND